MLIAKIELPSLEKGIQPKDIVKNTELPKLTSLTIETKDLKVNLPSINLPKSEIAHGNNNLP